MAADVHCHPRWSSRSAPATGRQIARELVLLQLKLPGGDEIADVTGQWITWFGCLEPTLLPPVPVWLKRTRPTGPISWPSPTASHQDL